MSHLRKRGKNSWQITVELGRDPKTGKRKRVTETVRGRKQDAEMRYSELLQEIRASNFSYKKPERVTVEEMLTKYLKNARNQVERSTWERYETIVKKHLIPALGHVYIAELTPHAIMNYYEFALEEGRLDDKGGLRGTTVRQHHAVLRSALQHAVERRSLVTNPAASVRPPKKCRPEAKFLSVKELNKLMGHVADTCGDIYIPVYIAANTGARRSEILGLRWEDVDLVNGRMTIQQGLHQGKGGELYFADVKTESSRRQIALTEDDVTVLKQHKKEQLEQKMQDRRNYQDHELVCAGPKGQPINPVTLSSRVRNAAKELDLKISLHGLRHTHTTLLLAKGAPMKFVSARLGHSTTSFTEDVYGHRTLSDDHSIAALFKEILKADESAQ